jgi:C-terminal processing protease CtpA/Prc
MTTISKKQSPDSVAGFFTLFLSLFFFFFCSCEEKEIPVPDPDSSLSQEQTVNRWIEKTMRTYYLWEDEIPEKEKLNFTQDASSFFFSLLTDKDGKTRGNEHYYYSSINKKSNSATKSYQGEGYSFGFEFQYYLISQLNKHALLVLYVLPGSPSEEKGLKRGDWIMEINEAPVPGKTENLLKLLDTTSPVTQTFGISSGPDRPVSSKMRLTAATVEDNPVFLRKIISYEGRRVAYLMYNHFTAGPTEETDDETFNNSLRDAFRWFKTEKTDEFILDLRYNGGGLVSSARLMATMLAPASALNDVFCYLTYNGQKYGYGDQTLRLEPGHMINNKDGVAGENLDLKRLYVITSSRTASASEAVINGLKPYMDVILTGERTEGKNVGSVTFDDDRFEWELHPIVSRLSNKDKFSDYENGFIPDAPCKESDTDTYYELGDEREFMLKTVLEQIAGRSPKAALRSSNKITLTPLYHSLDRKKTNGMLLEF